MSLERPRTIILRPAAAQRAVLLLGIVVAIVAGLLAMHTIAGGMVGNSALSTDAMAVSTGHHPSGADAELMADDCAGDCAPNHDMKPMVCVLALLMGGAFLIVGLLRGVQTDMYARWPRVVGGALHALRSMSFRDPPDLLKLSISRT